MATVNLSPINGQFFLDNGQVNSLGFLYTYEAGTSTPVATYTDNTGTIQNGVIIQLGADGRPPNGIWIVAGTAVKFVLEDINENLLQTFDNIKGIDDISGLAANGVNGDITQLTALTQLPAMVGMGIAPSAWSGINSSLDIGSTGAVFNGSTGGYSLANNAYFDGTNYRYKTNSYASLITLTSTGTITLSTAPSGTAGNVITFTTRFTLNNSVTPASGFSQVSLGAYSKSVTNFSFTSLTDGVVTTIAAPVSNATALRIAFNLSLGATGSAGSTRTMNLYAATTSAGSTLKALAVLQTPEPSGISAGVGLAYSNPELIIPLDAVGGNAYIKLVKWSANDVGQYDVRGYLTSTY